MLTVVPVLLEDVSDVCLRSVADPRCSSGLYPSDVLVVDNSRDGYASKYASDEWGGFRVYRDADGHNLGVARSWNLAAREVVDRGLDYLLILSAVMEFGPILHTTWREQMDRFWGHDVIECDGHSWHLLALHRRLFEEVGFFDGNFYPAYEESIDWCRRLHIVGREHGWPHCWVNAMSRGAALHAKEVDCPNEPLRALYRERWGGDKGEETWVLPYGNKPMDYCEPEIPIPELAAKYGLEEGRWW